MGQEEGSPHQDPGVGGARSQGWVCLPGWRSFEGAAAQEAAEGAELWGRALLGPGQGAPENQRGGTRGGVPGAPQTRTGEGDDP